ncbi:hypothetical protein A1O1_04578 [Capronia coronata CBS 617.96]|uniref:Amino acid transporter transmembrane domain-containing protein n=1 Tax=Capronia coronata CBS 617.96 TaxID=1182541 RepID=W9YZD1_9EURO|nr:uncharacterized protein A1O1_04578 [Capronia coronata CBS 617.96]EXJ87654.1 hypothetical protein A1O1_04578 [Capronia coronata CBS 617.96]
MEHIAPIAHPAPELDLVTEQQMRKPSVSAEKTPQIKERVWGFAARVDSTVTYEEYVYWAKIEREMEIEENKVFQAEHGTPLLDTVKTPFSKDGRKKAKAHKVARLQTLAQLDEKQPAGDVTGVDNAGSADFPLKVSDAEWRTAARALRTASWGQMFFLITTDILGWSGAPFVFASVGYGTGVALYLIFGIFAAWGGWVIWKTFLDLDSSRYPMQSFGDPFLRLFGVKLRHFINIAQSLQQFFTVSILIFSKALNIEQIAHSSVCFVGMMVVIMAVGMLGGFIRSLRKIGWISNAAVWMNIVNFIICMVAAAHFAPYYPAITRSTLIQTIEPIKVFAGIPPDQYQQQAPGFAATFNAVNTMVYAYAGALLFVAFLAEMRHPLDFWKGMLLAQAFITIVYMFFGVFVYSFYGQYSANNIVNVVNPYGLQTAGNVLRLLSGWIAIIMYFNIGMKTVYLEVFQAIFKFPSIVEKKGRMLWYVLGPCYWILAFIVAGAVPNLNGITSLVGAVFMMNFTYTFPGMMYMSTIIHKAAELPGEGFNPATRETIRHDHGLKRWIRGYKKTWLRSTIALIYVLLGLACCGMGTWAAIEGLIDVFGPGGTVAVSFGCPVPV